MMKNICVTPSYENARRMLNISNRRLPEDDMIRTSPLCRLYVRYCVLSLVADNSLMSAICFGCQPIIRCHTSRRPPRRGSILCRKDMHYTAMSARTRDAVRISSWTAQLSGGKAIPRSGPVVAITGAFMDGPEALRMAERTTRSPCAVRRVKDNRRFRRSE